MSRTRVYIAGPISSSGVLANNGNHATEAHNQLMAAGFVPWHWSVYAKAVHHSQRGLCCNRHGGREWDGRGPMG